MLGSALLRGARFSDAIREFERALALNPVSAATLCEIGRARFVLGDVEGAQRDLHRALEVNPENGQVTNVSVPEEYIHPHYRSGWSL